MVSGINGISGGNYSNYNVNNISTGNSKLDELIKELMSQGYTKEEAQIIAESMLAAQESQGAEEVSSSGQGVSSYGVSQGGVAGDDKGLSMAMQQPTYTGQNQLSDLNKFFLLGIQ